MLALVAPCWLGACGAGLVSAVFVSLFPGYEDRGKLTYPVVVYLICSGKIKVSSEFAKPCLVLICFFLWRSLSLGAVVTDALVAVLLLWRLWGARRQIKQYESSTLSKPLEKLMYTSVETGGITATLAVAGLITRVRFLRPLPASR